MNVHIIGTLTVFSGSATDAGDLANVTVDIAPIAAFDRGLMWVQLREDLHARTTTRLEKLSPNNVRWIDDSVSYCATPCDGSESPKRSTTTRHG